MFIAALLIATWWKQPQYPSTEERINKMLHIYTMEYYLDFKRNEILIHATTKMNLKNTLNAKKPDTKRPHIT